MNSYESQQENRARLGREYDIETGAEQGAAALFEAAGQAVKVPSTRGHFHE
jgi:hypothetical protein